MRFSANLGFLWADRPLTEAIHAAKAAGFDAVELHWPYETPAFEVARALQKADLPCLGVNTRRGNVSIGDNGLSALPERVAEARVAIDEALAYAAKIGAANLHVMAGVAGGAEAEATFIANLTYACEKGREKGIGILIEPLNRHDAPGYFLSTTDQAMSIIKRIGNDNLRMMFDCYHVQRTEGDLTYRLTELMPHIGHIQIASVPDRGAPNHGEIDFGNIFALLDKLGYERPIGAEYKPDGETDATLSWLSNAR